MDILKGEFAMKKMLTALILMLATFSTCLVGCSTPSDNSDVVSSGLAAEKANAAAIFTLDVNPGVRIYVKDDNTVITVEATNEDGEEVVAEIDVEGEEYEAVVEEIIDKMDEKGYLEGDESSVLVSIEKKSKDISDKVNDKIEKTFEKHGKRASIIEQEIDKLDGEMEKEIGDMAKRHHISEGKAHLIEKIREEFPELSEEDLAKLRVEDLAMMLEETSEHIRGGFRHHGGPHHNDYIGKEAALEVALESLEITAEDVTMQRVRVTRDEGKMLYLVDFVYDGMEYKILVDAETSEIIESESKEFVEFDAEGAINDFCDKHNITPDKIKDSYGDNHYGPGYGKDDYHGGHNGSHDDYYDDDNYDDHYGESTDCEHLSKGELLKGIFAELEIPEESLKETDVKMYETQIGTVYSVFIETETGDVYEFVVEAYSGMIIMAELNGEVMEIYAEVVE